MAAGTSHVVPNPHDAEEQLRPYLGQLHEADDAVSRTSIYTPPEAILDALEDQQRATRAALGKALELLGVQQ